MRFYGKVSLCFGGLYEAVDGGWFSPSTFALSRRILVCMKGFVKKQAFAAALFVFSVTAVFFLLSFLPDVPAKSPEKHYGGVVELWNVETFEGGSGSRTAWLTRQAAAFEREHEGLFVHVTTLSAEQAAQKLKEGERFDVLCFSGSGENYLPLLRPINAAVRSNVEASGTVRGVQYALPLYCGIYALFARQSQISPNAAAADALGFSYTVRTGKHQYVLQPVVCGFTPLQQSPFRPCRGGGEGKFCAKLFRYAVRGVSGVCRGQNGGGAFGHAARFVPSFSKGKAGQDRKSCLFPAVRLHRFGAVSVRSRRRSRLLRLFCGVYGK